MSCAIGLIALGVGYFVFASASKEKENGLRTLGKIVGIVIMAVSVLMGVCAAKCKMSGGDCGMMGMKGGMCPVSGKMMGSSEVPK